MATRTNTYFYASTAALRSPPNCRDHMQGNPHHHHTPIHVMPVPSQPKAYSHDRLMTASALLYSAHYSPGTQETLNRHERPLPVRGAPAPLPLHRRGGIHPAHTLPLPLPLPELALQMLPAPVSPSFRLYPPRNNVQDPGENPTLTAAQPIPPQTLSGPHHRGARLHNPRLGPARPHLHHHADARDGGGGHHVLARAAAERVRGADLLGRRAAVSA